MKWLKWFYANDKISVALKLWIYHTEVDLYFFPFLWQRHLYKADGFLVVRFGPLYLEADW